MKEVVRDMHELLAKVRLNTVEMLKKFVLNGYAEFNEAETVVTPVNSNAEVNDRV